MTALTYLILMLVLFNPQVRETASPQEDAPVSTSGPPTWMDKK